MDLEDQAEVQRMVETMDKSNTIVLLGQPDPNSSALFAETVTRGDPTWAGPLAGVSLGLPVFHILEPEVKAQMDQALYEEHVGLMEMTAEVDEIVTRVQSYRREA
jgi:glycine/sarcosine/betaine reductase complex component A